MHVMQGKTKRFEGIPSQHTNIACRLLFIKVDTKMDNACTDHSLPCTSYVMVYVYLAAQLQSSAIRAISCAIDWWLRNPTRSWMVNVTRNGVWCVSRKGWNGQTWYLAIFKNIPALILTKYYRVCLWQVDNIAVQTAVMHLYNLSAKQIFFALICWTFKCIARIWKLRQLTPT